MIAVLKNILIGVVCKDMLDYQRWVQRQSKNELVRYTPIINVEQASANVDEIVITMTATANPNFVDIYIKLNGAYRKAKHEG